MEPCFQFPQQNWKNLSRHLKPVPVTSPDETCLSWTLRAKPRP